MVGDGLPDEVIGVRHGAAMADSDYLIGRTVSHHRGMEKSEGLAQDQALVRFPVTGHSVKALS